VFVARICFHLIVYFENSTSSKMRVGVVMVFTSIISLFLITTACANLFHATKGDELRLSLSRALSISKPECADKVSYTPPEWNTDDEERAKRAFLELDVVPRGEQSEAAIVQAAKLRVAEIKRQLIRGEFDNSALRSYRAYALFDGFDAYATCDEALEYEYLARLYGVFEGTHLECDMVHVFSSRAYLHLVWADKVIC
jgi:hypothetical protein